MKNTQHKIILWVVVTALVAMRYATAINLNEPLHISADSARYQLHDHSGYYQGHVLVEQTDYTLHGEELMSYSNAEHQLVKVHVNGKPAYLKKKARDNHHGLEAFADQMDYFPQSGKILLHGHAKIKQQQDWVESDEIEYDSIRQQIIAHGGSTPINILITQNPAASQPHKS